MSLVFPHTFVPWFRAVAPYIHAYRGKTFVVALAGEAIAAGKLNTFVQDLAILHALGIKLVLVHGFRPQVTEQLAAKGHVSRYSRGIRITDHATFCERETGKINLSLMSPSWLIFSDGFPHGRAIDLGQFAVYLKQRIAAAPAGEVAKPAENKTADPVDKK